MIQDKKTIASTLFVLISFVCSAQTPPPPPSGPGPVGLPLPIDNGILVLLGAGLIFGIYKIYHLRKKHI
ncbi:hypothetical protein CLV86_1910 [Lacinutrix venerupis]|uniref:LPXTG-motif cell wall-anchored protein n=1 Tax=Lacinutrix venerupis TaxID=1486034 RepID=A0AAC9LJ16_9FLAO|nr:hypothetical protein [Lacinutrix venerupis]APX98963.1 hypothetical protein BWR22_01125 [Lacinutrix venerupis]RLJ63371.1 hypothetical protein CLV86_1910 [Lacinutrix venerupis]